jgi:glycopeptide antibiotics resistance protein
MVSLGIGGAYRGVDINDVLLNAAGVLLGYAFFRTLSGLFSALKSLLY